MPEAGLQSILDASVSSGEAPFLIALTADSQGITFSGTAGHGVTTDSILRVFSMTKAVAGLATAILVERRLLDLDRLVADILPEFDAVQVLEGFDGDRPMLRAPRTACTVGHLATHTSGLVYEFWNEDIKRYRKLTGHPSVMSGRLAALPYPLVFDPGTRWDYGIGIDLLGRVIEAVTGERIDVFCAREIFAPLGMTDTVFELDEARAARLAPAFARTEDGFAERTIAPPSSPEFYGMGHALYSTAGDYMRLLRMILGEGSLDGARLIEPETCRLMLANHIGELRTVPMRTALAPNSADVDLFPSTPKTHSLIGLRVEDDVPGMRSAGAQGWAGVLNTHWWVDPARDLAGLFMTQLSPFADPRLMAAYERFERAAVMRAGDRAAYR
jgi:methyl acetate hydrolase